MIVAAIILGIIGVACFIKWISDTSYYGSDGWGAAAALTLIPAVICFLFSLNWGVGTEQLTGYIYSSNDRGGYTVGHLRFSENAGTDEQPSFCAPSGSPVAQQIRDLAGTGKKVKVTVPPYFYFSNNPFACGTPKTTIAEVK